MPALAWLKPALHSSKLALGSFQQPLVTKLLCEFSADFILLSKMRKVYRTVFLAGMATGVADITSAFIIYGLRGSNPVQVLQSVASGWFGIESYEGGLATAAMGLFFHFLIALNVGAAYVAASRKLTFLVKWPLVFGPLYGIVVYAFMNTVVLPLSAFPHTITYTPEVLARGLLVHMSCVGSPTAFMTSYCSKLELRPAPSGSYQ
jgi:hypothetical protein